MSELKPCPFCGGKPIRIVEVISCEGCGAIVPSLGYTLSEFMWNARTIYPRIAQLEAAIKKDSQLLTKVLLENAELITEVAALKDQLAGKWLPIESVPDGKAVILWWPHWWHNPIIGYRRNYTWHAEEALTETHVDDDDVPLMGQALPPAPKGE